MSEPNPEEESLTREIVGLGALVVVLCLGFGAGLVVFLRLVLWLPETAQSAGVVTDVSTLVVGLSMVASAVAAMAVVLAVVFVGSNAFATAEGWVTRDR